MNCPECNSTAISYYPTKTDDFSILYSCINGHMFKLPKECANTCVTKDCYTCDFYKNEIKNKQEIENGNKRIKT